MFDISVAGHPDPGRRLEACGGIGSGAAVQQQVPPMIVAEDVSSEFRFPTRIFNFESK